MTRLALPACLLCSALLLPFACPVPKLSRRIVSLTCFVFQIAEPEVGTLTAFFARKLVSH